ncbi:MAG TPA: hypothetical protein VMD98_02080 [Bryocella sp.]|nr:hypothetical protein [Bryocella sp.]
MRAQKLLTEFMVLVVASALCGLPEFAEAQQAGQNNSPQQSQQQNGVMPNPAQGPLQPVPQNNQPGTENPPPQAPEGSNETLPATPAPQQGEQTMQQPLGAATAEGVPTVGGAASRPAGMAIAPAKQSQKRSLLIKIGLIAAAGIAIGTVYALSKGTSSKPK